MSNGSARIDHELQDYLDGRLPTERRAAFEERLARSPELRRELESALEIREALGSGDDVLSPGFYTRTRARFEQVSRQRESRRGLRLVSWETAGLAAAAALATALFVPWLTDDGARHGLDEVRQVQATNAESAEEPAMRPEDRDAPDTLLEQAKKAAVLEETSSGKLQAPGEEAPAPVQRGEPERVGRRGAGETKSEIVPKKKESRERDDSAVSGDWSPEPASPADLAAGSDRFGPPPPASAAQSVTRARAKGGTRPEPEEAREPPTRARSTPEAETLAKDDSTRLADRENETIRATAPSAAAEGLGVPSPDTRAELRLAEALSQAPVQKSPLISVELPPGLVAAGEVRSIENTGEWAALLEGSSGEALSMLGPPVANRRLVLVGARGDLHCEALVVELAGETYWLDTNTGRPGPGTAAGCAFTLPRDDRPVVLVPRSGEPSRR